MATVSLNHIEITPGICGGKPRVAGHRIRVQDIVGWHEIEGKSAEEIVAGFPQLTLAQIYAALAYYHDHREEIRRQMREDEEFVSDFMSRNPSTIQRKLKERDGRPDSLPS